MRPSSIIATTAGVQGPHTSPQTVFSLTLRIQFCCAVRPTDTQRPSIDEEAGAVCALAAAAGKGLGFNSKFCTTRFNEAEVAAALASDSGRADSLIRLRSIDASTRSRYGP